jgi:DNA-binding CsgD family transcriptional regulator/tetratricopeptide (TPR) repeat protein
MPRSGNDVRVADRTPVPLAGRSDSLQVLRDALARAAAGTPGVVVVSGETGVGKTRLVSELVSHDKPGLFAGSCVPVAGDTLPFAPLTQALRRLVRTPAARQLVERSPELSRLLPDADAAEPPEGPEGGFPQLRLFQSVLALLRRLGAERPLVHVVEDVHWADRSTLDLIRFLATNLTDERVLLVVTYRADEIVQDSPLRSWLAELGRLPRVTRIALERLDEAETAQLVRRLVGGPPDPALSASIVARSAGNPLFVEHLVWHAGDASDGLPETLHDLLRSRVAALPGDTRRVVRAASVIGRAGPVDLLAEVLGMPVADVEDHLRPAVDQHVVAIGREDFVGFKHPAFREVVYAELMPGERRRLHRVAAESLTAAGRSSAIALAEVANHWYQAGDFAAALDAALEAGYAAERVYAFADARASFARAVELMDVVPNEADRVDVLARAARAASALGEDAEAARLLHEALAATDDQRRRAGLLVQLCNFYFAAGRGSDGEDAVREALSIIPGDEVSLLSAQAHLALARLAAAWSRFDEAETAGRRALEISSEIAATAEFGRARNALGVVAVGRGNLQEAHEHLETALTIARDVGDAVDISFAYVNLSHVLLLDERLEQLVALCRQGVDELTRIGMLRQTGSIMMANAAEGLFEAGRLDEAERIVSQALALHTRGAMAVPILLRSAQLLVTRGDLQLAWERCEQARLILESENAPLAWVREAAQVAAEVELWAQRPEPAYQLVMDTLTMLEGTDEDYRAGILVAWGLRALGDLAEGQRDEPSRQRQREQLRELLRLAPRHPDDPFVHRSDYDDAWSLTERAELGRAEERTDPEQWSQAAGQWDLLGHPLPASYCRWREAEARLSDGVDATGIAALRTAHQMAVRLGAGRMVAELESLARWYRIDLVADLGPAQEDSLEVYGLTGREREVLGGLAAGRTNQEIADDLFISVKTASVHVSNILRKLGVNGRQDAARVAHRHGIRA